jgi:hypothetical protein
VEVVDVQGVTKEGKKQLESQFELSIRYFPSNEQLLKRVKC